MFSWFTYCGYYFKFLLKVFGFYLFLLSWFTYCGYYFTFLLKVLLFYLFSCSFCHFCYYFSKVRNFLGASSAPVEWVVRRARMPIPTMTIEAENPLLLRAGTVVLLPAQGKLAACLAGSANAVQFTWTSLPPVKEACARNPDPQPLALDDGATPEREDRQRAYALDSSELEPCVRYELVVTGAMASDAAIASNTSVVVGLVNEPLRAEIAGGDRQVGDRDAPPARVIRRDAHLNSPRTVCEFGGRSARAIRSSSRRAKGATTPTTRARAARRRAPRPTAPACPPPSATRPRAARSPSRGRASGASPAAMTAPA